MLYGSQHELAMEHSRVYVGNLPKKVRESDLAEVFATYGKIRYIDLKRGQKVAPYAVVEYQSSGEADHAAVGCDGCAWSALFGGVDARPLANQRIRVIRNLPKSAA